MKEKYHLTEISLHYYLHIVLYTDLSLQICFYKNRFRPITRKRKSRDGSYSRGPKSGGESSSRHFTADMTCRILNRHEQCLATVSALRD